MVLAAAAVVVSGIHTITTQEENCDNGVSRWECSDTVRDVSGVLFWVLLVALLVLIAVVLRGVSRRE
jgi:hypothetical protein